MCQIRFTGEEHIETCQDERQRAQMMQKKADWMGSAELCRVLDSVWGVAFVA